MVAHKNTHIGTRKLYSNKTRSKLHEKSASEDSLSATSSDRSMHDILKKTDMTGNPMMNNQMGNPMMNQMGNPMMNQMGNPMMNQMGNPMMNNQMNPMMNQMGNPMMDSMMNSQMNPMMDYSMAGNAMEAIDPLTIQTFAPVNNRQSNNMNSGFNMNSGINNLALLNNNQSYAGAMSYNGNNSDAMGNASAMSYNGNNSGAMNYEAYNHNNIQSRANDQSFNLKNLANLTQ